MSAWRISITNCVSIERADSEFAEINYGFSTVIVIILGRYRVEKEHEIIA